jgi:cyclopropane fatty-acyl-phospholipid synthase-like methyltransferase
MVVQKIPERLRWAVEELKIAGDERLLEIGCGRGVAVSLICPLLTTGSITAIDRSATAIDAARLRNKDHVAAGKVSFRHIALEDMTGPAQSLDKIFAVNVNLFWLDAARDLDTVRKLLAPGGTLFLFYEPPSLAGRKQAEAKLLANLEANRFEILEVIEADASRSSLFGVIARPVGNSA